MIEFRKKQKKDAFEKALESVKDAFEKMSECYNACERFNNDVATKQGNELTQEQHEEEESLCQRFIEAMEKWEKSVEDFKKMKPNNIVVH